MNLIFIHSPHLSFSHVHPAQHFFPLPLTLASKRLAVSFAGAGAKALCDIARSQSGLEKTRQLVQSTNPDVEVILKSMSVIDESAARELFEQIWTVYGKPTCC